MTSQVSDAEARTRGQAILTATEALAPRIKAVATGARRLPLEVELNDARCPTTLSGSAPDRSRASTTSGTEALSQQK